jgi:phosphoenolpyruvate synthase/pyruvate phosphate dikinase
MGITCRKSTRRRCREHAPEVEEGQGKGISEDGSARVVLSLDQRAATDPLLAGRKAANLAVARHLGFPVLPGFVITTATCASIEEAGPGAELPAAISGELQLEWSRLSHDGARALVVRSSSPGEDGGTSSMAGQFTSVLGVRTWGEFLAALEAVLDSARVVVLDGAAEDAVTPMAVLVQQQVFPAWGGVLFGVDPVTGQIGRAHV